MNQPYYLSAALPYVNGAPHLGHALEIVIADTFARYQRLRERDVCFTSGTDDNSLKSVRAAERAGAPLREHVQRNAARFLELWSSLDVGLDQIVHTSADPRHVATVRELWRRCAESGDIYRRRYHGSYCVGCEQYVRPADLEGGVCPVKAYFAALATKDATQLATGLNFPFVVVAGQEVMVTESADTFALDYGGLDSPRWTNLSLVDVVSLGGSAGFFAFNVTALCSGSAGEQFVTHSGLYIGGGAPDAKITFVSLLTPYCS